jgi:hypothetical protein
MFKRTSLLGIALSFLSATMTVQAQPDPLRFLRILVDGEPSFSLSIIEALRRNGAKYDLTLEFAGGYGAPYDLRLIASGGSGSASGIGSSDSCSFSYLTVAGLAPDGKLLFIVTQPNISADSAAVQVIQNVYSRAIKPGKQSTTDLSESQETAKPVESATVEPTTRKSLDEPGVYYKSKADWIRLSESTDSQYITRGGDKAVFTFGLSWIRTVRIYSTPSAKAQISATRPEFYIRGIAVSQRDISILRLERKKDHREIEVSSMRPGEVRGYRPNDIYRVKAIRLSDGLYKITPASELKPGEYILSLYSGEYEFGVTP